MSKTKTTETTEVETPEVETVADDAVETEVVVEETPETEVVVEETPETTEVPEAPLETVDTDKTAQVKPDDKKADELTIERAFIISRRGGVGPDHAANAAAVKAEILARGYTVKGDVKHSTKGDRVTYTATAVRTATK